VFFGEDGVVVVCVTDTDTETGAEASGAWACSWARRLNSPDEKIGSSIILDLTKK